MVPISRPMAVSPCAPHTPGPACPVWFGLFLHIGVCWWWKPDLVICSFSSSQLMPSPMLCKCGFAGEQEVDGEGTPG